MSYLKRVTKVVTPTPAIEVPKPKSTGSWATYAHKQVGPEVMKIKRPFVRYHGKKRHGWYDNKGIFMGPKPENDE